MEENKKCYRVIRLKLQVILVQLQEFIRRTLVYVSGKTNKTRHIDLIRLHEKVCSAKFAYLEQTWNKELTLLLGWIAEQTFKKRTPQQLRLPTRRDLLTPSSGSLVRNCFWEIRTKKRSEFAKTRGHVIFQKLIYWGHNYRDQIIEVINKRAISWGQIIQVIYQRSINWSH